MRWSVHILVEPTHEESGDARTVLFGHELVSVAGQPDIFESHEGGLYACLIEPLGDAMRIRTEIARLSGHFEDPATLPAYKLVRELLFNPSSDEVRTMRL